MFRQSHVAAVISNVICRGFRELRSWMDEASRIISEFILFVFLREVSLFVSECENVGGKKEKDQNESRLLGLQDLLSWSPLGACETISGDERYLNGQNLSTTSFHSGPNRANLRNHAKG
jgi:hypothetical protein